MSYNARIQQKKDTAANWESNNPVLLNGELIFVETSSGETKMKLGDGKSAYSALPFIETNSGTTSSNEADLLWGGKDLANSVSPVDASFIMELSANRFSFISPECITVEYSQDGGSTWLDYGLTDTKKTSLFTDNLTNICYLGKQTKPANVANQLRITVTGGAYFMMRKLAIYISTGGNGGCQCKVEKAKYTTQDTWTTVKTVSLGGYPGWNIINLNARYGGANSITDMYKLRLTFSITTASGSVEMSVQKIYAYSDQAWDFPSNLSRINHLYNFDVNQNAIFPAMVSATDFKENGTLLSSKYVTKTELEQALAALSFGFVAGEEDM